MKLNVLLFVISQLCHLLANAFYVSQSANTQWKNIGHYLQTNLGKVITQIVLSIGVYSIVLQNPSLMDSAGLDWVSKLLTLHGVGSALILGWFCDSFLDKILGFWGLKSKAN